MDEKEYQRLRGAYETARWGILSGTEQSASDRIGEQLRQFCLANGQDLEDLNQFFQTVDQNIAFSQMGT